MTGSADGKTVTVVFDQKFADWKGLFANLLPAHYVRRQPGGWNRGLDRRPEHGSRREGRSRSPGSVRARP